ncbi:MAG: peptidyl-prolyl cis-trans isomerase [Lachnospiraceae bacterium]|nr:peptidyl-prolyl cis-trans isomerase [Lachnospiraceae bacterium]
MRVKRLAAVLMAGTLLVSSMTGCGMNKDAAVATMKDQEVSLGLANFYCKFQQASYEDMYKSILGASTEGSIWEKDLSGSGTTMADNMKDSVMEELHAMYTLKAHMADYKVELTDEDNKAIDNAVEDFIAANSQEALKEMGADVETVTELLSLYTIQQKMTDAIGAEADTNVSDEEANMRGYSMVTISSTDSTDESGDETEDTDEEKAQLKSKAEKMQEDLLAEGATLESAAEANGYEVKTGTYAKDDSTLDDIVKAALDGLKEGETSSMIETESAYYFVRVDKETDEEATEQNRQSIISTRKSDHYNEVLSGWQENDDWKVDDKKLEQISFKNSLTGQDPNASTETEDVQSTQE